jgi:hypothetical protein
MRGFRPFGLISHVLFQERHSNGPKMKDEKDKRERQNPPSAKKSSKDPDPRQDRLKLALRENLKRRKSQARGRSDPAVASSGNADAALDDESGT